MKKLGYCLSKLMRTNLGLCLQNWNEGVSGLSFLVCLHKKEDAHAHLFVKLTSDKSSVCHIRHGYA